MILWLLTEALGTRFVVARSHYARVANWRVACGVDEESGLGRSGTFDETEEFLFLKGFNVVRVVQHNLVRLSLHAVYIHRQGVIVSAV